MVIQSQAVIKKWKTENSYYKVLTKCDRSLLQSASGITKCDRLFYKVRQVLQSATVITKWDVTTVITNLNHSLETPRTTKWSVLQKNTTDFR